MVPGVLHPASAVTARAFRPLNGVLPGRRGDDLLLNRIASPEMLPSGGPLPHLICSRPVFIGGGVNGADQHGDA